MNGSQLRDEGADRNLEARGEQDFATIAREIIESLIEGGEMFSSDDVWERMPKSIEPSHPNILPSLFNSYSRKGLTVPVGYTQSKRKTRHAGVVRLWRSKEAVFGERRD